MSRLRINPVNKWLILWRGSSRSDTAMCCLL